MQTTEIRETWTALYARLSLDDGNVGESMSIQSQKAILTRKAEELGIYNYRFYVDDGYSGTNFNRPSFQQMIADIEAGKVTCVITKDLSRLGRNYLESGAYIEVFFPKHQVRYIAVNDGVDSANSGEMDITPFKNILNEFYSRDVSKKVKSGKYIRASQGKFMGTHAPFGYQKDPENKHHLVPDVYSAEIVRRIFRLYLSGISMKEIALILTREGVVNRAAYKKLQQSNYICSRKISEKEMHWTVDAVRQILMNEVYTGTLVQGKTRKERLIDEKPTAVDRKDWIRVENTHEAIISRDVFEQVQKQIASRRRQQKDATTQIFAGLVKCADCGWSMRFGTNRQNKTPYSHFTCSQYGQMGTQCSAHYIRYDTLYVYVLSRIQFWSHRAQLSEEKLLQQILKNGDRERVTAAKRQESELKRAEKRKAEVDGKFVRMYEDWSAGRITEYNFNLLTKKYQAEQLELEEKISRLQAELSAEQQTALDAEKWISLIKQYANPTELTAELLNTLIEKIVIHEATKGSDGMREQEIEIYYRFIGKID